MSMALRSKRIVILASVVLLLALAIADIWVKKEAAFVAFAEQFVDEQRTLAYVEAHRGSRLTAERRMVVHGEGVQEVALTNTAGNIVVERAPGSEIVLEYEVTAAASDEAEAQRKLDEVQVTESTVDGRVTLSSTLEAGGFDSDRYSIDYTLYVPDGITPIVDNLRGTMRLQGIVGKVEAKSVEGLVDVVDIEGDAKIEASFGEVYIGNVSGNVEATLTHSVASISDVGGVSFASTSGEIALERVANGVSGDTANGFVRIRNMDGPVAMKSRSADVWLDDVRGDVNVEVVSGEVRFIVPAEGVRLQAAVVGGRLLTSIPLDTEYENGDSRASGTIGAGRWNANIEAREVDVVIHSKVGGAKP
ncbi:hypothetical protein MO973_23375 [Paenibacillus sp. TRM 82003]|nr:hypothetical protein [Paenibacillus sp. TRM 82003]